LNATIALSIRNAGSGDIPALLELYGHLHPDEAPPGLDEAALILSLLSSYPGSAVLLGFTPNELVASCTLIVIPNLTRGGDCFALIENVVTHSRHRNRGYGKALLKAAVDAAWRHGCYKVMLMTGSQRPETLNFYSSAGFEQTKTGFQVRRQSR
jgi:GNAT superfamily N-acetyltransferase